MACNREKLAICGKKLTQEEEQKKPAKDKI